MSLHNTRASVLLAWVNSLKLGDAVTSLSQLQDCSLFLKIIGKIHGTEEWPAASQQSVAERATQVVGFLQKICKYKASPRNLVSEEKLLAAEELELAKVVMLLLYYASMSDKIPREWTSLEYDLQTEMAKFLNFMLYNEDCLSEDLENFLQKKTPASSSTSSASSEETTPPKRGVPFLKLHTVASSSVNKLLPGASPSSSSSPVGEIMQTPQFQIRRLKKLLEAERENRDELEHELAENRKLIDEKDTRILVMKQRIDRLALLQERQAAADQLEPKEMEELRDKNESLLLRLHETLKQCQDLKTEKGQMDRKISQLSEENGDLTYKLREFSRTLSELQEAMKEMCEGQDRTLKEWEEQRSGLKGDLHRALGEKRCLEEKGEILQGKISLLEDQLAKLTKETSSLPVKGEVLGDVLKLEALSQQVSSLSGQQADLQASALRLQEEKRLLETNLQSERRGFEAEKARLTGLLTELQGSVSEMSHAKEKLEQDWRAQEERLIGQASTRAAEIAKLTGFLRQRDEEARAVHQQLEAERSQKGQLAEDWEKKEQRSRAAIEDLSRQVDQLSGSLKHSNQKVSQIEAASQEEYNRIAQEKEMAVRQLQEKEAEVASLAERLQALEQARTSSAMELHQEKMEASQKIQALEARVLALTTQGQQSEAQAASVPALKSQLREAQQKLAEKEKLAKEHARLQERLMVLEESVRNTEGILEDEKRRAAESLESNLRQIAELEEQVQELTRHKDQALEGAGEEKAKRRALEGKMQRLQEESARKLEELQRQVAELSAAKRELTERSGLEQGASQEQSSQKKSAELEAQLKTLTAQHQEAQAALRAKLSQSVSQVQEKTSSEEKLRAKLAALEKQVAATRQESAQAQKDGQEAAQKLSEAAKRLAEERRKREELEDRVKQLGERSSEDLTAAQSSLSSLRSALKEKEREVGEASAQVKALEAQLAETVQRQKNQMTQQREEAKRLAEEEGERAQAELATEKAQKVALEVQLQNLTNEHRVEVSGLQEEVARAQERVGEKERELEELRLKNVSRCEELRDLQKTVSKLKGELASVEALKEREAKMEAELQGFLEVARTREAEISGLKALVRSKDASLKTLEEQKLQWGKESGAARERHERQQKEAKDLQGQVTKLEKQSKEQQGTITKLEKLTAASKEQQQAEAEALKREAGHQRQKASELEKLLETSKAAVEKLKKELLQTEEELVRSRKAVCKAEEELAALRNSAQEKDRLEESRKEQVSRYRQEAERKASHVSSLEQDRSLLRRQLMEKEVESKDLRRVALAESEKSKKLEERLRLLQSEMATAASRAAERCSAMKAEAQNSQEQAEKLRLSVESLKKELGGLAKREEALGQEMKAWQEKASQKEQVLAGQQQELAGAQALIGELMPLKGLCQELQASQASQGDKHRAEVEQLQKTTGLLQEELSRAKQGLSEASSAKDRLLQQEQLLQQLRAENGGYAERLEALQRSHTQLAEEKKELAEKAAQGQHSLDVELAQAKQKHVLELEAARLDSEKRVAGSKQEAEEAQKKLEAMVKTYEDTKHQLAAQAEKLEKHQREQAKQVDELKKKLAQQEKGNQTRQQKAKVREEELRSEMKQLKEKTAELQTQLGKKEEAAEHYKAQMEKARTHYEAKKQQHQELVEKLKGLQQLEKENVELKAESERMAKELQRTALQATESELSLKNLTSQVRVLQAQLDFSDRQLREQGKVQAALETLKGRETFRQSSADISTDSLDLSTSDEGQPLNSTSRKTRRSLSESGVMEASKASQPPPHKRESLESLYFTPIPTRSRSKLDNSIDSIGNITLDSGRKVLSGRRRTTQQISITMIKKQPKLEALDSTNESFVSLRSSGSGDSGQESVKTRLRSAAASSSSIRSLASLPSQESLVRLAASSPDGSSDHTVLKSLPGYRPATRSSQRHSQGGASNTSRSSFCAAPCDDEPEPLDGWNRIAELQQRNRICPPHLKTCYPLESRPCPLLTTITDEEVMTGDPKETLRRASMLPSQIVEGPSTRRSMLSAAWAQGGVATRQQRKRLSDEPQTGPGTPEVKKSSTCFPRPQTPKGRTEDRKQGPPAGDKKSKAQPADKQSDRRHSLAFSILNTPKKLGSSLLRRGANRKVTPKNSPRSGSRRSPRNAPTPAKGKSSSKSQKVHF